MERRSNCAELGPLRAENSEEEKRGEKRGEEGTGHQRMAMHGILQIIVNLPKFIKHSKMY